MSWPLPAFLVGPPCPSAYDRFVAPALGQGWGAGERYGQFGLGYKLVDSSQAVGECCGAVKIR